MSDEEDEEGNSSRLKGGESMTMSLSAWDCNCAVIAVMEGCRGASADRYASNLVSRCVARVRECGEQEREVKGEMSEEVQSWALMANRGGVGEEPKEKFSLNMVIKLPSG